MQPQKLYLFPRKSICDSFAVLSLWMFCSPCGVLSGLLFLVHFVHLSRLLVGCQENPLPVIEVSVSAFSNAECRIFLLLKTQTQTNSFSSDWIEASESWPNSNSNTVFKCTQFQLFLMKPASASFALCFHMRKIFPANVSKNPTQIRRYDTQNDLCCLVASGNAIWEQTLSVKDQLWFDPSCDNRRSNNRSGRVIQRADREIRKEKRVLLDKCEGRSERMKKSNVKHWRLPAILTQSHANTPSDAPHTVF